MAKRGRIVRDPTAGPGLVIVQGRQHLFGLEGVWRSEALPKPGAVVDVEFDDAGRVTAMQAVPEARLAREQAEAAIALATAGGAGVVARVGLLPLAALGVLALGWFWLPAIHLETPPFGDSSLTFWRALGFLNAGEPLGAVRGGPTPSPGVYGLGALLCFAGPLLTLVWTDRRSYLATLLPLAFIVAVSLPLLNLVRAGGAANSAAVSLGAGFYVTLPAMLCLAVTGIRRLLVAAAHDSTVFYENK
jgi:hypothetical protein